MDNEKLLDIVKSKPIIISKLLLNNYRKLNISEEEFIILIYIINCDDKISYDPSIIANELSNDKFKVMEIVSSLCDKKIISLDIVKNKSGKSEEFINTSLLYSRLLNIFVTKEEDIIEDDSVYGVFEREFGRTLSPMEYEIIKGWINAKIDKDLIIEALKESIYNGVSNLRYIDKILFEWKKKNIKTKEDVIKDKEKYHNSKKDNVEVFDYNWLDE